MPASEPLLLLRSTGSRASVNATRLNSESRRIARCMPRETWLKNLYQRSAQHSGQKVWLCNYPRCQRQHLRPASARSSRSALYIPQVCRHRSRYSAPQHLLLLVQQYTCRLVEPYPSVSGLHCPPEACEIHQMYRPSALRSACRHEVTRAFCISPLRTFVTLLLDAPARVDCASDIGRALETTTLMTSPVHAYFSRYEDWCRR